MGFNPRNRAAIVGVGTSPFARETGKSTARMIGEALRAALADCGLERADIDGFYVNGGGDFDKLAERLGLDVSIANQF